MKQPDEIYHKINDDDEGTNLYTIFIYVLSILIFAATSALIWIALPKGMTP